MENLGRKRDDEERGPGKNTWKVKISYLQVNIHLLCLLERTMISRKYHQETLSTIPTNLRVCWIKVWGGISKWLADVVDLMSMPLIDMATPI